MAALAFGTAVCGAFLQVLFDKLASPLIRELEWRWGVKDELDKLRTTLVKIQAVVGRAEMRQVQDPSLRIWLRELKNAAYDSEDVLDLFATEMLRQKAEKVCYNKIPDDIAGKIKTIQEKLNSIAKERSDLKLGELDYGHQHIQVTRMGRETSSILSDPDEVFGRLEEKNKIVKLLTSNESLGSSSSSNLSVLGIVGIGGVGKTTLAQLVYNDEEIKQHFPMMRMWVCVSEYFDVKKITREMMESAGFDGHGFTSLEKLQNTLRANLMGKQFLLVLDDVWNENHKDWERLRAPLSYGARGSKVVVTTRNVNVAAIMGSKEPIFLKGLSDFHCWQLLKKYAFVDGNSDVSPNLEEIGQKIAKKLNGVPLAARTVGGLLRSKIGERRWKNLLESELWELEDGGEHGILPALKLSYQHLPGHLKQCFTYCSLFPKDYKYDKHKFIQIWMAQGFIQIQRGERAEDIGNDYFNDLQSRSFFQYSSDRYVMHGLVHDLARSVSVEECLMVRDDKLHRILEEDYCLLRHLSFSYDRSNQVVFENFHKFASLRTLLCLNPYNCSLRNSVPDDLFSKMECLRLLDLSSSGINCLPESIGCLKRLRYLDLSCTSIKRLPEGLCHIYNLQTLRLERCRALKTLPKCMDNLINLRHLVARTELVSEIAGIGKLTSLQNLEVFKVSKNPGYNISELKNMRELQGKLCIQKLEMVETEQDAEKAELRCKEHLHTLQLEWNDNIAASQRDNALDNQILECLQPSPNIKELIINCHTGFKFPTWMDKQYLNCIVSICLFNCDKWELLPPFGQLISLKSLEIKGMNGVKVVDNEFYSTSNSFPSLENLFFDGMLEWEQWLRPEEGKLFPCLKNLVIHNCPKLRNLPLSATSRSLETLDIMKCENLLPLTEVEGFFVTLASLKYLKVKHCPAFVNESLFIQLKNLSSVSCAIENHYSDLGSCVNEALQHLREILSFRLCCDYMQPCTSAAQLLFRYDTHPQGTNICHQHVHLNVVKSSLDLTNINNGSNNINLLRNFLQKRLPSASNLSFKNCEDIQASLGGILPHLKSLTELDIYGCKQLGSLFDSLREDIISLRIMHIESCPDLTSLSRSMLCHLRALEQLVIMDCEMLTTIEYQSLISLTHMHIKNCPRLEFTATTCFLSQSPLLPLRSLSIDRASLLKIGFTGNLTFLQDLIISGISESEFSPEEVRGFKSFISIHCLEIKNCRILRSLPADLQNIPSLKVLRIKQCPELRSLPPLDSPEDLYISGCPELKEWYRSVAGPGGRKIAHIPNIRWE